MKTALVRQLSAVADAAGNKKAVRGKASLLHDYQTAADIDTATIYHAALQAFAQLRKLDVRLQQYSGSLFSRKALTVDRGVMNRASNAALDQQLEECLLLFTDHFLHPAAFVALELLIRAYKVHEYNLHALLMMALPYHNTNEFVRLVQVCDLPDSSTWAFLQPMRRSGAALPRATLTQRCCHDQALLLTVCGHALECSSVEKVSRVFLSFYAVLLCDVVVNVRKLTEGFIAQLLPYLLAGFGAGAVPDYCCASIMVASQLSTHSTLGTDLVQALQLEAAKAACASVAMLPHVLMLLAHLANTQTAADPLPHKAFTALCKVPGLSQGLAALSMGGATGRRFMQRLLEQLVSMSQRSPSHLQLLLATLRGVEIDSALAGSVAVYVLDAAAAAADQPAHSAEAQQAAQAALAAIIKQLDAGFPLQVDAAVNARLLPPRLSTHPARPSAHTLTHAGREAIVTMVTAALKGTGRAPVGSGAGTLMLALESPAAGTRVHALSQLDDVMEAIVGADAGHDSGEDSPVARKQDLALLQEALLRRIQDDSLDVVLAALRTSALSRVPPLALLDTLTDQLQRLTVVALKAKARADRGTARTAATQACDVLASTVYPQLGSNASAQARVIGQLLSYLLPQDIRQLKLAQHVLPIIASLKGTWLQDLSLCTSSSSIGAQLGESTVRGDKADVGECEGSAHGQPTVHTFNTALVTNLSKRLHLVIDELPHLMAAMSPSGRVLLLLALADAARHPDSTASVRLQTLANVFPMVSAHTAPQTIDPDESTAPAVSDVAQHKSETGQDVQRWTEGLMNGRLAATGLGPLRAWLAAMDAWLTVQPVAVDDKDGQVQVQLFAQLSSLSAAHDAATPAAQLRTKLLRRVRSQGQGSLAVLGPLLLMQGSSTPALPVDNKHDQAMYQDTRLNPTDVSTVRRKGAAAQRVSAEVLAQVLAVDNLAEECQADLALAASPQLLALLLSLLSSPHAASREAAIKLVKSLCATAAQTTSADSTAGNAARSALLMRLGNHSQKVVRDGDALPVILVTALSPAGVVQHDASSAVAAGGIALPATPGKVGGRSTAGSRTAADAVGEVGNSGVSAGSHEETEDSVALTPDQAQLLLHSLIQVAKDLQPHGWQGSLLAFLIDVLGKHQLRREGMLLQAVHSKLPAMQSRSDTHIGLAARVLRLYNASALQQLSSVARGNVVNTLLDILAISDSSAESSCASAVVELQVIALQQLSQPLFALLPQPQQHRCLATLLRLCSRHPVDAVRQAAQSSVTALTLPCPLLLALLHPLIAPANPLTSDANTPAEDDVSAPALPSPKRKGAAARSNATQLLGTAGTAKKTRLQQQVQERADATAQDVLPQHGLTGGAAEECALDVLEMLLWKQELEDIAMLCKPLQRIVQHESGLLQGQQQHHIQTASTCYNLALALAALRVIVQQQQQGRSSAAVLDVGVVVTAARSTRDNAVRTAALRLLQQLARQSPDQLLHHVLQVVGLVTDTSAFSQDDAVVSLLLATVQAVVQPWVRSGRHPGNLVRQLLSGMDNVPAHRHVMLLNTMVEALPKAAGLPVVITELLAHAAAPAATATDTLTATTASASTTTSLTSPAYTTGLAICVAQAAELTSLAAALPQVLQTCMERAQGDAAAQLPVVATAFVRQCLVSIADRQTESRVLQSSAVFAGAGRGIMQQLLEQMHALSTSTAERAVDHKQGSRGATNVPASPERLCVAERGCFACLHQLEGVLESGVYLEALAHLSRAKAAGMQQRALSLFANKVHALTTQRNDSRSDVPAPNTPGVEGPHVTGTAAPVAPKLLAGALAVCDALPAALHLTPRADTDAAVKSSQPSSGPSPPDATVAACRAACSVVERLAGWLRAEANEQLEPLVPLLVALLEDEHDRAVRSSALLALCNCVRSLGPAFIPLLPQLTPALVRCLRSALEHKRSLIAASNAVTDASGGSSDSEESDSGASDEVEIEPDVSDGHVPTTTRPAVNADAPGQLSRVHQGPIPSDQAGESIDAEPLGAAGDEGEGVAALSTLQALLDVLGAFLSPYLNQLLGLLLSNGPASGLSGREAALVGAIVATLPHKVPSRLLLPALVAHLDDAVQMGDAAVLSLLELLADTLTHSKPAQVATYHQAIFRMLLNAMDLRRLKRPSINNVGAVEKAGATAFVALTMKLSEAQFKPMFLLLLEWATTQHSDDPEAVSRGCALYLVVSMVTERLRSVFVPYHRYIIDDVCKHLDRQGSTHKPAAKRRKADNAGSTQGPTPDAWLLQLRVIRSLHRCFLYDSVKYMDEARLMRLLPLIVAQLSCAPPAEVSAMLAAADYDNDLDSALLLGEHSTKLIDHLGIAVVGCLAQAAGSASSDALWKPINNQVLMQTRSSSPRTRLLGAEVVAQMVMRLREEYLVLLPETLPFLSELVEDVEAAVEIRSKQLVKQLEELSGESLQEYLQV